jgi:hypothetical protein
VTNFQQWADSGKKRPSMSQHEWQNRMQDRQNYGETAFHLALLIEQSAVCQSCREDKHEDCAKVAHDLMASKPTKCWCEVCKGTWG